MSDRKEDISLLLTIFEEQLFEELFDEVVELTGIKEDTFRPLDRVPHRRVSKEQVVDYFNEFAYEILRLFGLKMQKFNFREYGSNHFSLVLAKNFLQLVIRIEGHLRPDVKINWSLYRDDASARRNLFYLMRCFQALFKHHDIAESVLEYQNLVSAVLISQVSQDKISKEWQASLVEKVRIGTRAMNGGNHLFLEVIEHPEVYSILAYWAERLPLEPVHIRLLKNLLFNINGSVEGGVAKEYLQMKAREFLEEQGFDLENFMPPN